MRYRLRTFMMLLALGPPLLAGAWSAALPELKEFLYGHNDCAANWDEADIINTHLPMVPVESDKKLPN